MASPLLRIRFRKFWRLLSADLTVAPYWPSVFAKLAEKRSIDDLVMNGGAGGGSGGGGNAQASGGGAGEAIVPVKENEELKEESDDDMIFSLFD